MQKLVFEQDSDEEEAEEPNSNAKLVDYTVLEELFSQLTLSDELHLERMFILQIAIEHGWNMAKEVSLVQTGKYADPAFQKVAERQFKRELEEKKATLQGAAKRGRGGFSQARSSAFYSQPSTSRGFQGDNYSNYRRHVNQTQFGSGQQQLRCHACHGTGHWANTCPNRQNRSK